MWKEKECAKTHERTQHTVWCGTEVAAGDAGEVSRGQHRKAVAGHSEEVGQQWRVTGVYPAEEYWGDSSGSLGKKLGRGHPGHRSPGKCHLWPECTQWVEEADRLQRLSGGS